MATVTCLTSATNETYSASAISFIKTAQGHINLTASTLGISAGAIAGAVQGKVAWQAASRKTGSMNPTLWKMKNRGNLRGWFPLLAVFIFLCLVYFSWRGYLSANGYCHAQSRYLADKDYTLIAMSYVRPEMELRDADSPESYLRNHPECCAVRRPSATALGNLIDYVVEVELNFERKPTAITFSSEPYYTQFVEVTACGGRGHMYGEGSSVLKKPRSYP